MSTYDITLTDPLMRGFTIQPGGFDGPGGSQSSSSLRLYGRGALEWGEAVDENLVRLVETFAGSTPPLTPLPGQLWHCVKYYWHDSSHPVTSGWWVYNPNDVTVDTIASRSWGRLNGTGNVSTTAPTTPTVGSYYYNVLNDSLNRWDSVYKQSAAGWNERYYSNTNLANLAPVDEPERVLLSYSELMSGAGVWLPPSTITVEATAPQYPQLGTVWFNITDNSFNVYTASGWVALLGPGDNGLLLTQDLNMNSHRISNLVSGTIANGNTYAVNGDSVYDFVTNAINASATGAGSLYLPLTGGNITGNLTVSGTVTANRVVVGAGAVSVTGAVDMNTHKITELATPTVDADAANKGYVDDAITAALTGAGTSNTSTFSIINPVTPKNGDIRIVGTVISIYAGGWKQVFPAVYS